MYVGIDPGTRNLGICVWEDGCLDFQVLDLLSLTGGSRSDPTKMVLDAKRRKFFPWERASKIAVEYQMDRVHSAVCEAFRCLFREDGQTVRIRPHAWKKHHGVSMGKYKKNKQASIQKVLDLCAAKKLPEGTREKLMSMKKKDDAADAILMCLFARDCLSRTK